MMSRVFFSSYYSSYQQAGFDQEYLPYFYPLLNKIVSGFLLRVSLNLTFATPNPYVSEFHVDTEVKNSNTCVYYLNSNNGGTKSSKAELKIKQPARLNVPPRFRDSAFFDKGENAVVKIPFTGIKIKLKI